MNTRSRMLLGVLSFSWAAFVLVSSARNVSPDPYWPAYLIGGGLFGVAATLATRNAGPRVGRLLAVLGYLSLFMVAVLLVLPSSSDTVIELLPGLALPTEKFIAITLLVVPSWLLLSSRSGRKAPR